MPDVQRVCACVCVCVVREGSAHCTVNAHTTPYYILTIHSSIPMMPHTHTPVGIMMLSGGITATVCTAVVRRKEEVGIFMHVFVSCPCSVESCGV
jgi:hypothetical protein